MNTSQRAMLELIKSALFDVPMSLPDEVDWHEVYHEMKLQAVAYLPAQRGLDELPGMDPQLLAQWSQAAVGNMRRFYHVMQQQDDAVRLLADRGIHSIVLKGMASAIYYPHPDSRMMGDIDLLVLPERIEEAREILLENGYAPEGTGNAAHYCFHKNGVELEVHRWFAERQDENAVPELDRRLYAEIGHAREAEIEGFAFPMLPELEVGLVQLEHLRHHEEDGIGLRHVLDWVMYAARMLDDAFWYSTFRASAQELGLEKLAMTLTRMGQMYLGLPEEGRSWCMNADEGLCTELMGLVLHDGNFGARNASMGKMESTAREYVVGNSVFMRLQKNGCINFAGAIERHPWLRPFAWAMQIGRLAGKVAANGKDVRKIFAATHGVKSRRKLFEKMEIKRFRVMVANEQKSEKKCE